MLGAAVLMGVLTTRAATAQPAAPSVPVSEPGFGTQLFASSRSNLLGDMGGIRTYLGDLGITLGLNETSEVLGNVSGGVHQGAVYDGLTLLSAGLDTQKAFGWDGGTFNISALQIHGRNLGSDNLLDLQTPSGIEAQRATRLWELWYQQSFSDGLFDVKVGQQSIDQEFMGSLYSALFLNTMMGWPLLPSYDLYAGGPAYPLSSPGVRLRVQLTGALTLLGGVFDDNPPGGPFDDDSQVRGAEQSGTKFSTGTGGLFIAELQYGLNQPANGDMIRPGGASPGLPGTYKVGGWYDTAAFPDQRFGTDGLSLANPASDGVARNRRGNYSIYGVVDQMIWQPDPQGSRSVGAFARLMGAPGDRNLIAFSLDAGISLKAPFAGRDNDTVGIGYGLGQVSSTASQLDKDAAFFAGTPLPKRSSESFIEITYQYQAAPWWQIQPDIQYVFLPGGGIANPDRAGRRICNEAVLGLRTNITF